MRQGWNVYGRGLTMCGRRIGRLGFDKFTERCKCSRALPDNFRSGHQSVSDGSLGRPGPRDAVVISQVFQLLEGGAGEVLHDEVVPDPGSHLSRGGGRDGVTLVLEDDGPHGFVLELDDDRSRESTPLRILGCIVEPKGVLNNGVELWDGSNLVLIFGSLKNWFEYLVVHIFLDCSRRLVLCGWESKDPRREVPGSQLGLVDRLLHCSQLSLEDSDLALQGCYLGFEVGNLAERRCSSGIDVDEDGREEGVGLLLRCSRGERLQPLRNYGWSRHGREVDTEDVEEVGDWD
jgi:hypothetical protein